MFKMAFRVVYRIKGGCEECHALFHAYRAYLAFSEAIEEFETTVQLFITNKQARGRSGEVRRSFAPELSLPSTRRGPRGNGDAIAPEVISESGK